MSNSKHFVKLQIGKDIWSKTWKCLLFYEHRWMKPSMEATIQWTLAAQTRPPPSSLLELFLWTHCIYSLSPFRAHSGHPRAGTVLWRALESNKNEASPAISEFQSCRQRRCEYPPYGTREWLQSPHKYSITRPLPSLLPFQLHSFWLSWLPNESGL